MVRTQYYSEDIDAEGGLFPPERLALLYGTHPPQVQPQPGQVYAMALDVAGEDEHAGQDVDALKNPARDHTALVVVRVILDTLTDPGLLMPSYAIVYRQQWTGEKHTAIYRQILSLAEAWNIQYLVADATGVGAGLTAFLTRSLGSKVIPFVFNSKTKSDLGWSFLALVDSGRLKEYAPVEGQPGQLGALHHAFFQQLTATQYEIVPGPDKKIKWGVPDGTRDLATGNLIHDDHVVTAALLSRLDAQTWSVTGPAAVVKASDPLEDMKGF